MLMDVRQTKLANGTRIITSSIPRVESATLGIWVGVGSRYERNAWAGVSHFIEHLLFKGTAKRSAVDISRAIEGRGGYLNAFTQEESTCYYARVAYDQTGRALDVLCDMYLHPRLDPVEIDKERGVILEEIMMYRDQPDHVVQEMLVQALWRNHPLGRPVIGSPETLKGLSRGDIMAFKEQTYRSAETVFAFAGKVDHDDCVQKVEHLVGDLRPGRGPVCRRAGPEVKQQRMALEKKDIKQVQLALGIRLFGRGDKRRYALRLLNAVLGENMSSRLFLVVREKHGLAYSVHSSYHLFKDSGALVVTAGLDRKRNLKAVDLILRELARMGREPVGAQELKRAKDYVIGQLRLGLESTTQQMMWIGDNLLSFGRFILPEETIQAVSAVSAADIQALARSVIRMSATSTAMISPDLGEKDARAVGELLGQLDADRG